VNAAGDYTLGTIQVVLEVMVGGDADIYPTEPADFLGDLRGTQA